MSSAGDERLIGIDSGGTFTDLVVIDTATGAITTDKISSTPSSPTDAVVELAARADSARPATRLIHGTTVTTNALLQRHGARLCLVTTAGFEDVVRIQRINRPYAFDLGWSKPEPIVARRRTIGVRERIGPDGETLEALDDLEIERTCAAVADLVAEDEIEAIAVCLLFSFLDDSHERALEAGLRSSLPDIPISRSSAVSPIWREYERASTTLADAYVRPRITAYLDDLAAGLAASATPLILKSSGETGRPPSVAERPVTSLRSGLAGGGIAASWFASAAGVPDALTLDVGGTSADVGLVRGGRVGRVAEFELEWGLPIVTPAVDIHPVGAGGGSIASIDRGGVLCVGPESAGADPGPIAYGLGGDRPTVTDANLVLGRLEPTRFLGGRMPLDRGAALAGVTALGEELEISADEAAHAVVTIAAENIANSIRTLTIERGADPRDFTLIAFGGAGPTLACAVADTLGIERVLVPPHPGVCSAFGAAVAELGVTRSWSVGRPSNDLDEAELRSAFARVEADAVEELTRDGAGAELIVRRVITCRYVLQNYEEEIALVDLEPGYVSRLVEAFHQRHLAEYGYAFEQEPIELVTCAVSVVEPARGSWSWQRPDTPMQELETRELVDADASRRLAPILRRGALDSPIEGPAVIEEDDSTTFVPLGWSVVSDQAAGSLEIVRSSGGAG